VCIEIHAKFVQRTCHKCLYPRDFAYHLDVNGWNTLDIQSCPILFVEAARPARLGCMTCRCICRDYTAGSLAMGSDPLTCLHRIQCTALSFVVPFQVRFHEQLPISDDSAPYSRDQLPYYPLYLTDMGPAACNR
jgi:hypothetical protein